MLFGGQDRAAFYRAIHSAITRQRIFAYRMSSAALTRRGRSVLVLRSITRDAAMRPSEPPIKSRIEDRACTILLRAAVITTITFALSLSLGSDRFPANGRTILSRLADPIPPLSSCTLSLSLAPPALNIDRLSKRRGSGRKEDERKRERGRWARRYDTYGRNISWQCYPRMSIRRG